MIQNAVLEINKSQECHIRTWQDCSVSGKPVIGAICEEIDKSDIFLADLTGANPNVLFELGYAIGKNKRVWLLLDTSISNSKQLFDKLRILTTVGYSAYSNSQQIRDGFYRDQPWRALDETIYKMSIEPALIPSKERRLIYLKNQIPTESSIQLSRIVASSKLPTTLNDPSESEVQSLAWYAANIWHSLGVIVHLSGPERQDAAIHNARYAFVSGLAHGLEKPLLMLAPTNYITPIDYRDILKPYTVAAACRSIASDWLEDRSVEHAEDQAKAGSYAKRVALSVDLRSLNIGEHIAENEEQELSEYFVETQPFLKAIHDQHSVVVGRKGSGKTASLYMVANTLEQDKRNLVCVIKPVSYDAQGIVRLGKEIKERDKKGYLAEALWKFLIYSEIARVAYDEIVKRPYCEPNSPEEQLKNLMEAQGGRLQETFAVRLETCVSDLLDATPSGSIANFRQGVSERLHASVLRDLRKCLGQLLTKRDRVAVLIDNLDKAWDHREDLKYLADFLYALLRVRKDISEEFGRADRWRFPVNVSITIFLRSDIFAQLRKDARERDKLEHDRISWDDGEALLRVLDKRLSANRDGADPDSVWREMFCSTVNDIPTRDHILNMILLRPRDLLFFSKAALSIAVNRGHTRVEEGDILLAEKDYSQFVFEAIQVENGISLPELEAIMYEFVGGHKVLSRQEVQTTIEKSGLESARQEYAIAHLIALSFLGVEVNSDQFRYCMNPDEIPVLTKLSERYSRGRSLEQRYRVHNAFHAFLEVT